MVELGIDVWRFGGGVESVAVILVVGLVYRSVSAGVGLVYRFGSWSWVSNRVSSCGFLVGVSRSDGVLDIDVEKQDCDGLRFALILNLMQHWCKRAEGEALGVKHFCYLNEARKDEKDVKIRELTAELQRERKRSAAFQEQLDMVLKDTEDHSHHLSRNIDDIVQSAREIESKRFNGQDLNLSNLLGMPHANLLGIGV
nr:hypothetical protein CFP56_72913 [Quercus suber]